MSALSFLGFGLTGFALAPSASVRFWSDKLFSDRVGIDYYANQGIRGVLHRFGLSAPVEIAVWSGVISGVLVLAVLVARRAVLAGEDMAALLAVAVLGLLASPISWAHHWVWVVPVAVVLPRVFTRSGLAMRCLLTVATIACVVGPLPLPGVQPGWLSNVLVSPYLFLGVGLLVALAIRLPRRARRQAPVHEPGERELVA